MTLVDLNSELLAAESLPDLAGRLGARCLDKADHLTGMKGQQASCRELDEVADRVKRIPRLVWEKAIADPSTFETIAGPGLLDALRRAWMRQPLDFLGVLHGLCQGALDEHFRVCTDRLELDRGMPIPFATRTPPEGVAWMTWQGTQAEGGLLDPLPWTLYPFRQSEGPKVVLDHSHRERIDELTWTAAQRLPRIATVHPAFGELDFEITRQGKFFDVRPKHPDHKWLLDRLAAAKDAQVGVLPELCLARPDELEAELAADPDAYPPLVVAGSAHLREGSGGGEVRANESRVYLDGELVAAHRKIHVFKTKILGEQTYAEPLQEDLSGEPKSIDVLAATHTRLAVVICADLLDEKVPGRLLAAGVNLMLAPAMTTKAGSFETTVEEISGRCQGVSAVANTRHDADGKPFLCMLGTPRADRDERFAALGGSGVVPPPDLAVFDSHEALPGAVEWR
jgi:hypothetical protein